MRWTVARLIALSLVVGCGSSAPQGSGGGGHGGSAGAGAAGVNGGGGASGGAGAGGQGGGAAGQSGSGGSGGAGVGGSGAGGSGGGAAAGSGGLGGNTGAGGVASGGGGGGGGAVACSVSVDGGEVACTSFLAAANAYDFFCGLKAGAMTCWANANDTFFVNSSAAVVAAAPPNLRRLALSNDAPADHNFCAVDDTGHGFCWGDHGTQDLGTGLRAVTVSDYGKCTLGTDGAVHCDTTITAPPAGTSYVQIVGSEDVVAALDASGTPTYPYVSFPSGVYTEITASDARKYGAIRSDGAAVTGQSAGQMVKTGSYVHLAMDDIGRACAIDTAGELACWLVNPSAAPLTNLPAGPFVQIVGANSTFCALRSSGTTACWGDSEVFVPAGW